MSKERSIVQKIADRFEVDAAKLFETLKATAFLQQDGSAPTNEQMMALLVVADQYGLNPFTREIYAFPDKGRIVPVVGVDGWCRIVNSNPHFDGVEFTYSEEKVRMTDASVDGHAWIECTIYRNDRKRPTIIREYLEEVYRPKRNGFVGPWQTHTKRQHRHKTYIQCARMAFGFVGIYDPDEAERIKEMSQEGTIIEHSSNIQPASSETEEVALVEHKELDPMLNKLTERAIKSNAWEAAHQYVEERYSGTKQKYAVQKLREAQLDQMEPPKVDYRELQQESSQADNDGFFMGDQDREINGHAGAAENL